MKNVTPCGRVCPGLEEVRLNMTSHSEVLSLIPKMSEAVDNLHCKIDDLSSKYEDLDDLRSLITDLKGFVKTLQRFKEGGKVIGVIFLFIVSVGVFFNKIGIT